MATKKTIKANDELRIGVIGAGGRGRVAKNAHGVDGGKINLSIKRTEPKPQREGFAPRPQHTQARQPHAAPTPPPAPKTADQLFEEKLKAFMTESDSKISGIKQYSEHRTKSRRR